MLLLLLLSSSGQVLVKQRSTFLLRFLILRCHCKASSCLKAIWPLEGSNHKTEQSVYNTDTFNLSGWGFKGLSKWVVASGFWRNGSWFLSSSFSDFEQTGFGLSVSLGPSRHIVQWLKETRGFCVSFPNHSQYLSKALQSPCLKLTIEQQLLSGLRTDLLSIQPVRTPSSRGSSCFSEP